MGLRVIHKANFSLLTHTKQLLSVQLYNKSSGIGAELKSDVQFPKMNIIPLVNRHYQNRVTLREKSYLKTTAGLLIRKNVNVRF